MANFNFNKVILGGRLTADPELKSTASGTLVLAFTVAVTRRAVPKNEDGTKGDAVTDFINCVAWRERAEFISKYFKKGSSICVTGAIQTRSYQDKDGNKRYATEVIVDEVCFVDAKGDSVGRSAPLPSDSDAPADYSRRADGHATASQASAYTPSGYDAASAGASAPGFEVIDSEDELPF